MLNPKKSIQKRCYSVFRHIVASSHRGLKHRVTQEVVLVRIWDKPCLPNGQPVQLSRRDLASFNQRCRKNGQTWICKNRKLLTNGYTAWKLVSANKYNIDGVLHTFDTYPRHCVGVQKITCVPHQIVETALEFSDISIGSEDPIFHTHYGLGCCLFGPVVFSFIAEIYTNQSFRQTICAATQLSTRGVPMVLLGKEAEKMLS